MDALRSPVSAGLSREEDTTACSHEEEMRGGAGGGGCSDGEGDECDSLLVSEEQHMD